MKPSPCPPRRQLLAAGLLAGLPWPVQAALPRRLRLPDPGSFSAYGSFFLDLIGMALRKTGPAERLPDFDFLPADTPRERLRQMLAAGELDLLWTTTTPQREQEAIPVRVNLLKGINELRFLLVRAAALPALGQSDSLDALRRLRAGAGLYWSDTLILRANGFRVETASRSEQLFRMLGAGRFDFIPRTRREIDEELRRYADQGFAELPGVALQYPQPLYFFVSHRLPELAGRLKQGLALAMLDGTFDAMFMADPGLRAALKQLTGYAGRRLVLKALGAEDASPR